jgi:hypothetical protein
VTRATADPRRAALDQQMLAWMREPFASACDDARFDATARAIFAFQFEHCVPYRRFCAARGATPSSIASWREIPAVPAGAFKEVALRCFPAEREVKTFRTSGTSAANATRRGELHLDTLALYEASLLPTIEHLLLPDLRAGSRALIRILAPSPDEAPDSSLSHMFGCLIDRRGSAGSGYDVTDGALDARGLIARLERACRDGEPVALCGTAFAFVHLLDAHADRPQLALPAGSRVMETGGFKGRVRELSRDALYARIEQQLGVPPTRVVNQYGMTELGSQFYDSVLALPGEPRRKLGPPWARARILDPETGRDAARGATGMIAVHDLANTGSVAAILTEDLGRFVDASGGPPGFEVLGRQPDAEARGCSIAADLMLGA